MLKLASLFEGMKLSKYLESMKTVDLMPLIRFGKSELLQIFDLAKTMTLGGNKFRSLIKLVDEIRRIREVEVAQLLEEPELKELLNRPNLQGPVRYRLVKQLLERWRNPELTRLRQDFESARKSLGLPHKCSLETNHYFEEEELTLKISAGSVIELYETLNTLTSVHSQDAWESLFRLFKI